MFSACSMLSQPIHDKAWSGVVGVRGQLGSRRALYNYVVGVGGKDEHEVNRVVRVVGAKRCR